MKITAEDRDYPHTCTLKASIRGGLFTFSIDPVGGWPHLTRKQAIRVRNWLDKFINDQFPHSEFRKLSTRCRKACLQAGIVRHIEEQPWKFQLVKPLNVEELRYQRNAGEKTIKRLLSFFKEHQLPIDE